MRYVAEKIAEKIKKIMFGNPPPPEYRAVREKMWKTSVYSETGHRCQCDAAHAHYMPDNSVRIHS